MAFSRPTLNTIYLRIKVDMESRVTSGVKIPKFSLLGIMAIVFAGAVHLLYAYLVFISDQLFVDTATTEWLDRLANIYGVPRKAAAFSSGQVTFTGVNTTVIPEGTSLQNNDGLTFSTVAEVTITGGSAVADVQADIAGVSGNITDTSLFLVSPLVDVDTEAFVTTAFGGGQDQETDPELRLRLLQRIQNPPSSGTKADYIRWALEVAGVGKAWVLAAEEYAGAGTVAVSIATTALEPVDSVVHQNVVDYIASVKPVGANVDVEDVVTKNTDYQISITPNTLDLRNSISDNLKDLHLVEAQPGGTLLITLSMVSKTGLVWIL